MTDLEPGSGSASPTGKIASVRTHLLGWFRANARDLPWRNTRDPYAVLVSEVMLQQTQVDRVVPYYNAFLARFPTTQALADAPTADVIRLWAGLGYNRRAVNLQRTAAAVVERGGFPCDPSDLRTLPGIGPYTAGAVACFAFEQDVAFVDTNMRRVVQRLFFGAEGHVPAAPDREILAVAQALIPTGGGWEWNQALIEFGALQCTARKPACVVCPLQADCAAFPAVLSPAPLHLRAQPTKKTEEPFATSSRYFRGRILAAVRDAEEAGDGLAFEDIGRTVRPDYDGEHAAWLSSLVDGLVRDGLLVLAEEQPKYDSAGEAEVADRRRRPRVRLP